MEDVFVGNEKYSMFEDKMSCIMAPYIQYIYKKVHELLRKECFQVLIYCEQHKAETSDKDLNISRRYGDFSECYED